MDSASEGSPRPVIKKEKKKKVKPLTPLESALRKMYGMTCGEIVFCLILYFIVKGALISTLWDDEYLDFIMENYNKGPITDVKLLNSDQACDYESMGGSQDSEDKYEIAGQGYWWGTNLGCVCEGGSGTDNRECTKTQVRENNCYNVRLIEPVKLPIVNNKIICSKRDAQAPVDWSQPDANGQCSDGESPKLCGEDTEFQFCVPNTSTCPLVGVKYQDGQIMQEDRTEASLPLLDLMVSQGHPCAKYNKDWNALTEKETASFKLLPDEYDQSCPELKVEVDGEELTFTTDETVREVQGYPLVSEYTLLQQNGNANQAVGDLSNRQVTALKQFFDQLARFEPFNEQAMQNYNFQLYEKSYPHLDKTCMYTPKDSETPVSINAKELYAISREAATMVYLVKFLSAAFSAMMWIAAIEFVMNYLHAEDALSTECFDKIFLIRRIFAIIFQIMTVIFIQMIYSWDAHDPIQTLSDNNCTDDPILEATFDHMKNYMLNAQSTGRRVVFFILLSIVIALNIGGIFFKMKILDPFYKKDEKKGIKEPLIKK